MFIPCYFYRNILDIKRCSFLEEIRMEEILVKRREVLFNNLVLLGLDQLALEKKHGIKFTNDMFVLPNKKGYEVVTHFLFTKLAAVTGKDYNLPWPLLGKEHDRIFQKTTFVHLTNFAQENCVRFPRLVPSLLSTFGGDRFYELYMAFSSYIMSKTLERNGVKIPSRPVITQDNYSTAKDILQLQTIQYMQKFKEIEKVTSANHLIWSKLTSNLSRCLQKLKVLLKSNEDLLKTQQNALSSVGFQEGLSKKKMMQTCMEQMLTETFCQGKKLQQFFKAENKYWMYLASEVDEHEDHQLLNGQEFNICTDNLPEEWLAEFEKVGVFSSDENGNLSIVRFIKLLLVYLRFIFKALMKDDLSTLHKACYVEGASSIEDSLNYISNLIKKLEDDIIPSSEKVIQNLKLISCFEDAIEPPNFLLNQACSPVPDLSFSPSAVKDRVSHLNLGEILKSSCSGKKSNDDPIDSLSDLEKCSLGLLTLSNPVSLIDDAVADTAHKVEVTMVVDSNLPGLLNSEGNSDVFLTRKSEVTQDKGPTASSLDFSSLDDLDFAPSTPFKMRGSWLQEESLNSVTLPDLDNSEYFV